jgi:hypothetical protein
VSAAKPLTKGLEAQLRSHSPHFATLMEPESADVRARTPSKVLLRLADRRTNVPPETSAYWARADIVSGSSSSGGGTRAKLGVEGVK